MILTDGDPDQEVLDEDLDPEAPDEDRGVQYRRGGPEAQGIKGRIVEVLIEAGKVTIQKVATNDGTTMMVLLLLKLFECYLLAVFLLYLLAFFLLYLLAFFFTSGL